MKFRLFQTVSLSAALFMGSVPADLFAWHDRTHLAIAEASGFDLWYSAAAPDVVKSKEKFSDIESPNHYFNNSAGKKVNAEMVMEQVERYDRCDTGDGHLYGAIVGAVRAYRSAKSSGKYARYPLVYCAHYVGDLSMPLHNTAYDDFNRKRHSINDGVIDAGIRDSIASIRSRMKPIAIRDENELAREIAAVAESARKLGRKIRKENRNMTSDEAYTQVILSASLFKAILAYADTAPATEPAQPR
ncbi:MAG: hypothetical protein HGA60_04105 [Chlorobiaceae bacterium]|nr:S1/P1 nuclease [Chlorobiales bacterium]NTU91076.1 hypothetical protein [Chlorobiaceae bacterium]